MKVLKPLPHAILDYAWAGTMIAAPWLFGFRKNKTATINSISSGAAILGLSLMTRYPLGALKLIPFPVHGVIETIAGAVTATSPWVMGFSKNERATLTHMISGLSTLGVVLMTDYNAAQQGANRSRFRRGERGAGLAEQMRNQPQKEEKEKANLGPPAHFTATADSGDKSFSPV